MPFAPMRPLGASLSKGTLLQWEENPPSVFLYDRLSGLAMTVHACAVIALSILLVGSVNRTASSPVSLEFQTPTGRWIGSYLGLVDAQSRRLSFTAGVLAAGIGAFTLGAFLSFPIVRRVIRPVPVQLAPGGIFHGHTWLPWEETAMWRPDRGRRMIGLYAGGPRPTLAGILHPPTDESFHAAEELLRQRAPQAEDSQTTSMNQSHVLRVALVLFGTVSQVLIALLFSSYVAEWVWFVYGVEILALEGLGLSLARA